VVFVTHDLHEALLLGARIALMEAGQLITLQTRDEFLNSRQPLVVAYKQAFDANLNNIREQA